MTVRQCTYIASPHVTGATQALLTLVAHVFIQFKSYFVHISRLGDVNVKSLSPIQITHSKLPMLLRSKSKMVLGAIKDYVGIVKLCISAGSNVLSMHTCIWHQSHVLGSKAQLLCLTRN